MLGGSLSMSGAVNVIDGYTDLGYLWQTRLYSHAKILGAEYNWLQRRRRHR